MLRHGYSADQEDRPSPDPTDPPADFPTGPPVIFSLEGTPDPVGEVEYRVWADGEFVLDGVEDRDVEGGG